MKKNSYNPFYPYCYIILFISQLFEVVGNALFYCLTNRLSRSRCSKHIWKL